MKNARSALEILIACAALGALGCNHRQEAPAAVPVHTPQGQVERVDRLQFLSGASAAIVQAEDLYRRGQPSDESWTQASRLLELARASAAKSGESTEAEWERKASAALGLIQQGSTGKNSAQVNQGLEQIKLYIDQAQQAASIEY